MRRKLPTTCAALVFAALSAGPAAADGPATGTGAGAPTVREQADVIMNLTYEDFARAPHTAPFNWTTDGCSVPSGFTPYSKVFKPACVLHDFGYRNYGGNHELKLSPERETKNWVDGRFRTEMKRICDDRYKTPLRHRGCRTAAAAYYEAVNKSPQADKAFF